MKTEEEAEKQAKSIVENFKKDYPSAKKSVSHPRVVCFESELISFSDHPK